MILSGGAAQSISGGLHDEYEFVADQFLKATPHNYCRSITQSDFSSDCMKTTQEYAYNLCAVLSKLSIADKESHDELANKYITDSSGQLKPNYVLFYTGNGFPNGWVK